MCPQGDVFEKLVSKQNCPVIRMARGQGLKAVWTTVIGMWVREEVLLLLDVPLLL